MSYCVNCGVELEASLRECPLCHTPVINPMEAGKDKPPSPYPTDKGQVEEVTGYPFIRGADRDRRYLFSAKPFGL